MTGVFLGALAFGIVLVGASMVVGEGDGDGDADGDADGDDLNGGGPGLGVSFSALPFASLRFWSFAAAAFGAAGLLCLLLGMSTLMAAMVAGLMGASIGWLAFQGFRWLARETLSEIVDTRALAGSEARVLLAIRPAGVGKIVLERASGRVELIAKTGDDAEIAIGSTVLVVAVVGGVAEVTAVRELPRDFEAERRRAERRLTGSTFE